MSPILITVIVALVAVFAVAAWMDMKRRRLRDTKSGSSMGKAARQTKLEGRDRGGRWGAGA